MTTYTCHWCGHKIRTPWRSPQQPLDRCPMCGGVAVQKELPKPKGRKDLHYGQEGEP